MSNVNRYVSDYCVIDIETTGLYADSEIIEISSIKVRNGLVVDEYSSLIDPCCHIPIKSSEVHHITDEMVVGCPTFDNILPDFIDFIGNDVLVGYNIASFDLPKINRKVEQITGNRLTNDYLDVLYAVRRKEGHLENKSLESISKHYDLNTEGEHRALTDCYLTHLVLHELFTRYGEGAFTGPIPSSSHTSHPHVHFTQDTMLLQELQNIIQGILSDGVVSPMEAFTLQGWMDDHMQLQGHFPFDRAFCILDKVLEDGVVTPEESTELAMVLSDAADPIHDQQNRAVETLVSVKGKHFCLTGEFSYGKKSEVEALIEQAGGIIDSNTRKTTDYIAVGDEGSSEWITGNYGTKIKKALEYNHKYGTEIKIIEEENLIPSLKYIIAHVNVDNSIDSFPAKHLDWIEPVKEFLISMEEEEELPKGSLYLADNIGKNAEVISRSICICEPDFSHSSVVENPGKGRNYVVINIKENVTGYEFTLTSSQYYSVPLLAHADVTERMTSNTTSCYVKAELSMDELISYLKANIYYALSNYKTKENTFGCCHLFGKCCDARKCLHINKLYATACSCYQNMLQGKYLAGKYRNIDNNLNRITVIVPEEKLDPKHQYLMQQAYRKSISSSISGSESC